MEKGLEGGVGEEKSGRGQARDEGVWIRKVAIGWGEVHRSEKNIEGDKYRR